MPVDRDSNAATNGPSITMTEPSAARTAFTDVSGGERVRHAAVREGKEADCDGE